MTMKGSPKILIVEDNKNNHLLYREAFEEAGFEVEILSSADGFFTDVVNDIAPDIISMDLMIGKNGTEAERDGFAAIQLLKSDTRTQHIPIIVLTSFFEENKVRQAKELGAVDFITVTGQSIQKIPGHYLRYLEDHENYKPSHPIFREDTRL